MRSEASSRPAVRRAGDAEAPPSPDRVGATPPASASFQAGYDRFLHCRRSLRGEGAAPRVASALANLGVETLTALGRESWDGPDGLAARLARQRWIGEGVIRAVKAQYDEVRAGGLRS